MIPIPDHDPLRAFLERVTVAALLRQGRGDLIAAMRDGADCLLDDSADGRLVVTVAGEVVFTTDAEQLAKALDYIAHLS